MPIARISFQTCTGWYELSPCDLPFIVAGCRAHESGVWVYIGQPFQSALPGILRNLPSSYSQGDNSPTDHHEGDSFHRVSDGSRSELSHSFAIADDED